ELPSTPMQFNISSSPIFNTKIKIVGITEKNDYFMSPNTFEQIPGQFSQTYDKEVALLDLISSLGSEMNPAVPDVASIPRCIKNLQAEFAFHTDISSVPRMKEFRAKAQQIIHEFTKYFDIPQGNIDLDDDTCEYNRDQMEDKAL
ncbi:hypothetical protein PMAYCL1PPCAC_10917, partial [Pristionchus mayeri]